MKRYDIRMDDADCEESATGAWVMWIDAELESLQRELDESGKNAVNLSSLVERVAIKLGIVREPFEPVSDEVSERLAIRGAGWDIEGMEGLIVERLAAKDAELAKANLALDGFKRVYETQTAAILEWEAKVKARDGAIAELQSEREKDNAALIKQMQLRDAALAECVSAMGAMEWLLDRDDSAPGTTNIEVGREKMRALILKHKATA